ncbi:PapB/FocB family fimbrial expression transcriptional regulator [Escherichia coli]|nr:hypothetical protein [Escherichia coli]HBB0123222.1 hypothetical protein [Escherichia coli]
MEYENIQLSLKPLLPGKVVEEQFLLIIDISSIRSEKIKTALWDFFVLGEKRNKICEQYNVNQGYLSLKIKEIQSLVVKLKKLSPYFIG